jgi:FkbM family methyltransferase
MGSLFRKLKKITSSISQEGLAKYIQRIYDLGVYRFYLKRAIFRRRLHESQARVFDCVLHLPGRIEGIKEELILYGTHEPNATKIYKQLLRPGDVIFDIGTNLGYYLCVANNTLGSDCQIQGFEPDEELFSLANKNSALLNSPINIKHCAISDKTGLVSFFKSKVSNWGTIVPRDELKLERKVDVDSITIDSFVEQNNIQPTVIRMDIEGGETKALKGGLKTLRKTRLLFLEYHKAFISDRETDEVLKILEDSGFRRAIWCDRYYDFPWSNSEAQIRLTSQGEIGEFKQHCLNEDVKVYSLFLYR